MHVMLLPHPWTEWEDRCLWKHYLPATTVAAGNNFTILICDIAENLTEIKEIKDYMQFIDMAQMILHFQAVYLVLNDTDK